MCEYTESVDSALKDLSGVSTGVCPGCSECKSDFGCEDMTDQEFQEQWQEGKIFDEGGFSRNGCGICGTSLGITVYSWHWIDEDGNIQHESDCCEDCLMYINNGDVPEQWEG